MYFRSYLSVRFCSAISGNSQTRFVESRRLTLKSVAFRAFCGGADSTLDGKDSESFEVMLPFNIYF